MHWQLHVARLAVLSRLPFQRRLRHLKRRLVGYEPDYDNLRTTIHDLDEMEAELGRIGRHFAGSTVLEIGTGWFPTVPIALALRGARHVYMTDLNRHLDRFTFSSTVAFLRSEGGAFSALAESSKMEDFPFTYLAPLNMSEVPERSIDIVISRAVLEHISEARILELFRALRPKLSATGIMVHCVDHSDHLEHRDKSLSKVNFLTWQDRKHAWVNFLTGEGENRLRHSDYLRLFADAGFRVVLQKGQVHAETARRLQGMKLTERFRTRPITELATLKSLYIAAPEGHDSGGPATRGGRETEH